MKMMVVVYDYSAGINTALIGQLLLSEELTKTG